MAAAPVTKITIGFDESRGLYAAAIRFGSEPFSQAWGADFTLQHWVDDEGVHANVIGVANRTAAPVVCDPFTGGKIVVEIPAAVVEAAIEQYVASLPPEALSTDDGEIGDDLDTEEEDIEEEDEVEEDDVELEEEEEDEEEE